MIQHLSNDNTVGFCNALAGLEALGNLLQCVDPARWDSLARPKAVGLANIIFSLHHDLVVGVEGLSARTLT